MRKIISLIAVLAITLASCSNDDKENKDQSSTIEITELVATWNATESLLDGDKVDSHDIMKFSSDGSVQFTYVGFGTNGRDVTDYGSYTVSGNTVVIKWYDGGSTSIFSLQELNNKKMRWKSSNSEGTLIETFSK